MPILTGEYKNQQTEEPAASQEGRPWMQMIHPQDYFMASSAGRHQLWSFNIGFIPSPSRKSRARCLLPASSAGNLWSEIKDQKQSKTQTGDSLKASGPKPWQSLAEVDVKWPLTIWKGL